MRHNWERIFTRDHPFGLLCGSVRKCKNCGTYQKYDIVSYDRMSGSTYRWRPLAGKCKPLHDKAEL